MVQEVEMYKEEVEMSKEEPEMEISTGRWDYL